MEPDPFVPLVAGESRIVRMVTTVATTGVRYEVFIGPWRQWEKFVLFGKKRRFRPGGEAFQSAAHKQAEEARRACDLVDLDKAVKQRWEQGI